MLKRERSVGGCVDVRFASHMSGNGPGVTTENGETKYRTFAVFARDQIITKFPQVAARPAATPSGRTPASG